MKAKAEQRAAAKPETAQNEALGKLEGAAYRFFKVLDGRKQPVRGLWVRNGRYYARLTVEDAATGDKSVRRVALEKATTVPQAVEAMRELQVQRKGNDLPVLRRTPKFNEYVEAYLAHFEKAKDAKRPRTVETERGYLKRWVEHLGETRLDRINRAMLNAFIAKHQEKGWCGRTVNLAVTILRNVLKHGIEDGWLKRLPTENLRPLKWTPKKRALVTAGEIEKLCNAAFAPVYFNGRLAKDGETGRPLKNAQQFADYVGLMGFCGARASETLRLKWTDVDWERRQLTIGSDGQAKNHKTRIVDFNPDLERHLKAMATRRAPDSDWLFPSPQRGDQDKASKTFRESLLLARKASGLAHITFHDLRHHFVSFGVMSGIDYMTIARWVGHQDGGVLIGKVYGHLSNEHAQRQAQRIVFNPAVLREAVG